MGGVNPGGGAELGAGGFRESGGVGAGLEDGESGGSGAGHEGGGYSGLGEEPRFYVGEKDVLGEDGGFEVVF